MNLLSTEYEAPPRRILALDLGTKRIGLAISDELGITAQGLETLARKNKRTDFDALARLVREKDVRLIVVGNPLRMSGEAGRQAEWARRICEGVAAIYGDRGHAVG